MATVTLTSKGQLTLPRPMRDALGLAPGARLQASIDAHGRLVLVLALKLTNGSRSPWELPPRKLPLLRIG